MWSFENLTDQAHTVLAAESFSEIMLAFDHIFFNRLKSPNCADLYTANENIINAYPFLILKNATYRQELFRRNTQHDWDNIQTEGILVVNNLHSKNYRTAGLFSAILMSYELK
jgi:hypothetical protein